MITISDELPPDVDFIIGGKDFNLYVGKHFYIKINNDSDRSVTIEDLYVEYTGKHARRITNYQSKKLYRKAALFMMHNAIENSRNQSKTVNEVREDNLGENLEYENTCNASTEVDT